MTHLFKVLTEAEFVNVMSQPKDVAWLGTKFDIGDGFIHLCGKTQIQPVLQRYYSKFEFVFVLLVDESTVSCDLKWEMPHGGDEAYPHLYAGLELGNMRSVKVWKKDYDNILSISL